MTASEPTVAPSPTRTKPYWIPRTILAVAVLAAIVLLLPPRQALPITALWSVACFATYWRTRWFVAAVVVAVIAGAVPWKIGGALVVGVLLGVPFFLAICHFVDEEILKADGFDRSAGQMLAMQWGLRGAALIAMPIAAAAERSWGAFAVALPPTWMAVRGRRWPTITTAALLGLLFGVSAALLVPVASCALLIAWAFPWRPPPRLRFPLASPPWRSLRLALRLRRIDRAIRYGRPGRARALIARTRLSVHRPWVALRQALLGYEEGDYQAALDALSSVDKAAAPASVGASWELLHAAVLTAIGRPEAALPLLDRLAEEQQPPRFHLARTLSYAEALLARGEWEGAAERARTAVAMCNRRADSADRFRAHRFEMDALRSAGQIEAAVAASQQGMGAIGPWWWEQLSGSSFDQMLISARGKQMLELVRLLTSSERIDLEANLQDERQRENVLDNAVATYFAMAGAWRDFAEHELLCARLLGDRDETHEALKRSLRAVRELDRTRYALRSQGDRAAWAAHMREGLTLSLHLAERSGESQMVAELLELSRIQALPRLNRVTSTAGDLSLAPPPIVRVRGTTNVLYYHDAARPDPVDLEAAAMSAAGPGGWWLSYWQGGDDLYWSLIPPSGPTWAGRIPCDETSPLALTLAMLRAALPIQFDHESPADMDLRMAASPFVGDPRAERRLSAALGRLLLPDPLVEELTRRLYEDADPLRLAISACPEIGFIPWSLLVVKGALRNGTRVRLVELAEWTLAPSAALTVELAAREQTEGSLPLRLAVLDTWEGPTLAGLDGARALAGMLPPECEVLGGRHWSARVADRAEVLAALVRAGRHGSAVFACHALQARAGESSSSGLVLAAQAGASEPELLTARDLLALAGRGVVPAQIYLQACDTSDIGSAAGGEWLTIAPGFLIAGAQAVCTTLFPVPDGEATADPALTALLQGTDLGRGIRELQRRSLRRWDGDEWFVPANPSDTPLAWGAYAMTMAGRSRPEELQALMRGIAADVDAAAHSLRKQLASAAKTVREMRGSTVSTADLLTAFLGTTDLVDVSLLRSIELELGLPIASRFLAVGLPTCRIGPMKATEELVRSVQRARAEAAAEGRRVADGHVLRVALREKGTAARRVARVLAATGVQSRSQLANLVEDELAAQLLAKRPDREKALTGLLAEQEPFVDALLDVAATR